MYSCYTPLLQPVRFGPEVPVVEGVALAESTSYLSMPIIRGTFRKSKQTHYKTGKMYFPFDQCRGPQIQRFSPNF